MPKLTSALILKQVISDPNFKAAAEDMAALYFSYKTGNEIRYNNPPDITSKEYVKGLQLVQNPKQWCRDGKQRVENVEHFKAHQYKRWDGSDIIIPDNFDDIEFDEYGTIDVNLKQTELQNWVNSNYNKKKLPMHRIFVPKDEGLCESYRLEVWTTHDDTQIICWSIIVD